MQSQPGERNSRLRACTHRHTALNWPRVVERRLIGLLTADRRHFRAQRRRLVLAERVKARQRIGLYIAVWYLLLSRRGCCFFRFRARRSADRRCIRECRVNGWTGVLYIAVTRALLCWAQVFCYERAESVFERKNGSRIINERILR